MKDVWNFGRKIKFGDLGEATRDQQIAAFQSWLKSDAQRAVCDLSFADALGKFIEAIEQADVPPGLSGLAERAGAASIGGPIPRCWREVAQFIHDPVCRLLQVAWWMSQQVGPDQPFPLTQSNVAAWLGSDTWRASRVVTAMQAAGVLKCTNRGRQRGKGKKGLAALYLFVKFSQDTDPEPEGGFHG